MIDKEKNKLEWFDCWYIWS